jgi:hypothetical protein
MSYVPPQESWGLAMGKGFGQRGSDKEGAERDNLR